MLFRSSAQAPAGKASADAAEEKPRGRKEHSADDEPAGPRAVADVEGADREQHDTVSDQKETDHEQRSDRSSAVSAPGREREPIVGSEPAALPEE